MIKPNHFAVANAVGAAIAQVSGEVDRVYALAEIGRERALDDAKTARDRGRGGRRRARATASRSSTSRTCRSPICPATRRAFTCGPWEISVSAERGYVLREADLLPLSIGAALLGTGGGGNPYIGMLRTRELFRKGATVRVLPLDALPDDAWVGTVGSIGAPVIGVEKISEGAECYRAMRAVEEAAGNKDGGADRGRDRRRERDGADHHRRAGRPAGGRRRRHGPRLSRSTDVDVRDLRRRQQRGARPRSPTTKATSS